MTIRFKASYVRDLDKLKDANLIARIQQVVEAVEQAAQLQDVPNVIKIQGGGNYYRIRVGDYRLGLSLTENVVTFVRCLNRKDIYKNFP